MEKKDLRDLSRLISHALRHEPEAYGIRLDANGWIAVPDLIEALRKSDQRWQGLTETDLHAVAGSFEKKRHEIANGRIRASYGHSTEVAIERTAVVPPSVLYHGTSPEAVGAILREGLRPMERSHVHLSVDLDGARQVGLRKSEIPILLAVKALEAHAQGNRFYQVDRRIWLTDALSPAFIEKIG
jgi:putative RNA 2'-phosphotransferase